MPHFSLSRLGPKVALACLCCLQAALAAPLETATAEYRSLPREVVLDGMVEATKQATVSAQTGGRVDEILFDVDDYVEQGALIIRLRNTEQKAALAQAQAQRTEAEARLKEAHDNHKRIRALFEKKLVANAQLDQAAAGLKSAQARLDAAHARLSQSQEQFEYTQIKAPYAGIVTQRHIEVGETAHPGQELMTGLSLNELRVTVDAPQSLVARIRERGEARVISPENPMQAFTVVRLTVFPIANPRANTFKLRLDLPPGTPGLFPGMFVKTAFVLGERQALLVPTEAVVHRSEVSAVYVAGPDGKLRLRQIRPGRSTNDGMTEIHAGLSAGEKVALDPIAAGIQLKEQ